MFNPQDTLEIFQKQFPHEKIITLEQKEGTENYIIEINNTWICKVPKRSELNANLAREASLLPRLQGKCKINIPIVEYYEPNIIIYRKIKGVELKLELFAILSQEQKDILTYDIAYFLYQFHNSLTIEKAQQLGFTKTNWPWFPEKLSEKAQYLEDLDLITIFQPFIKEYTEVRRSNTLVKLIHDDINPRNILIDETYQLCGILDFTDVALDDPYFDLRMKYSSSAEFTEAIAKKYTQLATIKFDIKKIYSMVQQQWQKAFYLFLVAN
jgi:serine/threonine protein kinase